MDQKKRRAILTAVELGNLTRAAEALGYTQSGLSYLITSLEQELGFPLLVRSRSGVRPTADCQAILPYFRELERKLQQVEQVASDIRGLVTGTVSIGVFPSISRDWLPDILRDFDAQYPGITVHIQEGDQEALDTWLADGTIDIAFSSRSPSGAELWIQFMEDEYFAILPKNHPLAQVGAVLPRRTGHSGPGQGRSRGQPPARAPSPGGHHRRCGPAPSSPGLSAAGRFLLQPGRPLPRCQAVFGECKGDHGHRINTSKKDELS